MDSFTRKLLKEALTIYFLPFNMSELKELQDEITYAQPSDARGIIEECLQKAMADEAEIEGLTDY